MQTKETKLKIENLSVKELRQRLFTKQSSILFDNSEYTFQNIHLKIIYQAL